MTAQTRNRVIDDGAAAVSEWCRGFGRQRLRQWSNENLTAKGADLLESRIRSTMSMDAARQVVAEAMAVGY